MRISIRAAALSLTAAILATAAWAYLQAPPCASAYCGGTCIDSYGCIAPCLCAKRPQDGYGVCVSTN